MGEPQKDQPPRPRYKRSAKNYLLDPHFQFKYTAFLVGIALILSAALGTLLWGASVEVIQQSRTTVQEGEKTVQQGQETVKRGKDVIVQSRKVSDVVRMNIMREYADNPELAKTFGEEAEKDEAKLKLEQENLEADAASLEGRSKQLHEDALKIEERQKALFTLLVVALLALVGGIGVAGIIVTHRIAGPVHKMKRMIRELGEGKLALRERLRKGDELQHLFDTFEQMVENLREKQKVEIGKLDAAIEGLGDGGDEKGRAALKKLREEMQAELGD